MNIEALFNVRGKTALITGGSRGLGDMIARAYVENGVKVYISSRKADACADLAQDLSSLGECVAMPADLSTLSEIQRLAGESGGARKEARHPRQQCGRELGRFLCRLSRIRLGPGDEPQSQIHVLLDPKAFAAPQGGGAARRLCAGDQHRLD